ncbi:MAG TPA: class I SAM-dependent rRNA methyltransferase [Terriglobales bacterium]|nr:class I SAM-dependent rRNA methyltransferase [Terriglobales bacterium]
MPKKSAVSAKLAEPSVKISARGVARLQGRHPWVYRSDIAEPNVDGDNVPSGSLVRVLDQRGKFLGTALYSSSSQIAIRMISHGSVVDLPALVAERIRDAIGYRKELVSNSDAYRIVFSEADFVPGLIVDRYNDVLCIQILTQAMDAAPVREAIVQTLREELQPAGIVERVDARIRELEQLPPLQSRLLWGEKSSTVFTMNSGVRFHYDGLEGQKTGAFLDQRQNYAAAAQHAHGDALDAFCYQGGFALHFALQPAARCSSVTGVDSSRQALEMAEKNATLNGREMEWMEANAFDLLREYAAANRRYDTVVLDPPAFAKTRRDLEKALGGYKELNLRAMKMLRPGGILVTCSCSFHVGAADFFEVVADAARDAHKTFRVVENRGAAKDHPVLLNVPETRYLKCLILSVSN